MDRGAWRATVHQAAKSQTGLNFHEHPLIFLSYVFQRQNLPQRQNTSFRLFFQALRKHYLTSNILNLHNRIRLFIFNPFVSLKIQKISSCYSTKLSRALGKERAFVRDSRDNHLWKQHVPQISNFGLSDRYEPVCSWYFLVLALTKRIQEIGKVYK